MITYQVFDNDKPADCRHHNVHSSWNNSTFDSLEKASCYADKWLGYKASLVPDTPFDYSGYGNIIEIRKINQKRK